MSVSFSAVWKDDGFLASAPPMLVVPQIGIGLVYLNGARSFDVRRDLKFDRNSLTVEVVATGDVTRNLASYSQNFPSRARAEVLALAGSVLNKTQFGSKLLSVEGYHPGITTALDLVSGTSRANMDVLTAGRKTVSVSFRFVRYQDAAGQMKGGTGLGPDRAEGFVEVLNRLFLPSANVELTLKSSKQVDLARPLGDMVLADSFQKHVVPLRDQAADLTVFFVGKYKGKEDPLGEAFPDLKCVVVDDAPWQYIAPERSGPRPGVTDDEIYNPGRPLDRPRSERDLHIVLAHEVAHALGAGHNGEEDNLMSMGRQDLKLNAATARAISG